MKFVKLKNAMARAKSILKRDNQTICANRVKRYQNEYGEWMVVDISTNRIECSIWANNLEEYLRNVGVLVSDEAIAELA